MKKQFFTLMGGMVCFVFMMLLSHQTFAQIIHNTTGTSTTFIAGATTYFDSGGAGGTAAGGACGAPIVGDYQNSEFGTRIICPTTPATNLVRVQFTAFNTEGSFDFLTIRDGNLGTSPILLNATAGNGAVPVGATFTASIGNASGCLLFFFDSDTSCNAALGWATNVSLINRPLPCTLTCPGPITVNTDPGTCTASASVTPVASGDCVFNTTIFSTPANTPYSAPASTPGVTTPIVLNGPFQAPAPAATNATVRFEFFGDVSFLTGCGATAEAWNVFDENGNFLGCSNQTVNSLADCGAPDILQLTVPIATYNAWAANGSIGFSAVTVSNQIQFFCGVNGVSTTITYAVNAPSCSPLPPYPGGTTNVICTAFNTDGSAVRCTTAVTVVDREAPRFPFCPPALVTLNLLPGECSAVYNYDVTAVDNCPPRVVTAPFGPMVGGQLINCNNGAQVLNTSHFRTMITGTSFTLNSLDFLVATTANGAPYTVTLYQHAGAAFPGGTLTVLRTASGTLPAAGGNFLQQTAVPNLAIVPGMDLVLEVNAPDFAPAWFTSYGAGNLPCWLQSVACGAPTPTPVTNFGITNGLVAQLSGFVGGLTVTNISQPFQSGDRFPIGCHDFSFRATDGDNNSSFCNFRVCVNEYPFPTNTMTCNDNVQVSLEENGCTLVGTDMVLEGGPYACYDNYIMQRVPPHNGACGPLPAPGFIWVDCEDIGKTITVKVTDPRTGSYCWGKVRVEDKLVPVITCTDLSIGCSEEIIYNVPVTKTSQSNLGAQPPFDASTRTFNLPISAPANATVNDVNISLVINHTWVDDMRITLRNNGGAQSCVLFNQPCPAANDNVNATFDDAGPNFFCSGGVPVISGTMKPQGFPAQALANFNGFPAGGTWTLEVADLVGGDAVNIVSAQLNVNWTGINLPPTATDNCEIVSTTYIDDIAPGSCSTNAGVIRRTWKVVDQSGNSATCVQTITRARPSLTDVEFPEDYDGIDNPVLDCTSPYPDTFARVRIKDTARFAFTAPQVAIPDNGQIGVVFDLNQPVSSQRRIEDINVRFSIQHPNVTHLQLFLQKLDVNGNVVASARVYDKLKVATAANPNPAAPAYIKCSNRAWRNLDITFDDEGCDAPHEGCVDFTPTLMGTFKPWNALSALDQQLVNQHANGDWRVLIRDTVQDVAPPVQRLVALDVVYIYSDPTAITTPTIAGAPFKIGDACNFSLSYYDEVLDICPTSYKLLRYWTVLDWCTGGRLTSVQLIKVLDTCPPVVYCPRTNNTDQFAQVINVYDPSIIAGSHGACVGNVTIPPIDICYENCSGVGAAVTKIYGLDGSLVGSVNTNGGTFPDIILDLDEGTDDDPDCFLPLRNFRLEPDARYRVVYEIKDNCGNQTTCEVFVRVIDKIPPVPVCREVTQVAVSSDQLGAELCAKLLDEGSYDNCGGVHFYVREMIRPDDTDPVGSLSGLFAAQPIFKADFYGLPGVCNRGPVIATDLNGDSTVWYKYKPCTKFDCSDIGQDNQVFLLVVDDYVQNYIDHFLFVLEALLEGRPCSADSPPIIPPPPFECVPFAIDADGNFYLARSLPGSGTRTTHEDLIGWTNTAVLWEGHYNFCMVQVLVEDKVRPTCDAPDDVWTTCAQIPDNVNLSDTSELQRLFGDAVAYDNCGASVTELTPTVSVDHCGVGSVVRTWRARDAAGLTNVAVCRQRIVIMNVTDYELRIPGDFEDECTTARPDTLQWAERGCDLLAVNREDREFPASPGGECKKIVRTYSIINWCEYDGFSPATEIPRLDRNRDGYVGDGFTPSNPRSKYRASYLLLSNGDFLYLDVINDPTTRHLPSTGYYTYIQHIKIYDDHAPELRDTSSHVFCGGDRDEDPCTGNVSLLPWIEEICTPDNITIRWSLDAFNDGTYNASGTNRLTGRYPLGHHRAHFWVSDDCGNTSEIDIHFDIIDCKAPTPVCHNGLSVDLMPTGMVEVWACDFDASSYDYCHPFQYRINKITDVNGDGFITSDDYRRTPPRDNHPSDCDSIVFTCNDLGVTYVQLWVGELSSDNVNNWDYCVTFIEVQDNLNACSGSKKVGGKIADELNRPVDKVSVELSTGGTPVITDNSGNFLFNGVVPGSDVTVTPRRDDKADNGVSTFDLVLISKHILNVQKLDSPYKMIAADANNSRSISTLDLVALRKLVLKVETQLPNNTSWRFVEKGYTFPNPTNPWDVRYPAFPEVSNFNNISADELNANFVAIKVGDVNGSAKPNSLTTVEERSFKGMLKFKVEEANVQAGEEFRVEFVADQDVQGYQMTLNYDRKAVELVDVTEGLAKAANFNVNVEEGAIATSWNEETSINGATMFTLVFRAKAEVSISELFTINDGVTQTEAYNSNGELMGVGLEFSNGTIVTSDFALYQNNPNPFKGETIIGFNLPEASTATLTISDVTGKVVKVVKGNYAKGYNTVVLKRSEIGVATGMLTYQLTTATHSATKQMIIVE